MRGHRDGAPALPARTEWLIAAARLLVVVLLGITATFTAYSFLNASVALAALGVTALLAQVIFRHTLAAWIDS